MIYKYIMKNGLSMVCNRLYSIIFLSQLELYTDIIIYKPTINRFISKLFPTAYLIFHDISQRFCFAELPNAGHDDPCQPSQSLCQLVPVQKPPFWTKRTVLFLGPMIYLKKYVSLYIYMCYLQKRCLWMMLLLEEDLNQYSMRIPLSIHFLF